MSTKKYRTIGRKKSQRLLSTLSRIFRSRITWLVLIIGVLVNISAFALVRLGVPLKELRIYIQILESIVNISIGISAIIIQTTATVAGNLINGLISIISILINSFTTIVTIVVNALLTLFTLSLYGNGGQARQGAPSSHQTIDQQITIIQQNPVPAVYFFLLVMGLSAFYFIYQNHRKRNANKVRAALIGELYAIQRYLASGVYDNENDSDGTIHDEFLSDYLLSHDNINYLSNQEIFRINVFNVECRLPGFYKINDSNIEDLIQLLRYSQRGLLYRINEIYDGLKISLKKG
ncbi:hypothetical protein [Haladaptatus sp. DFWS20]|uniref:hypothetical protein n=1 Tax=Haladaptatus sp. DFWS20 TaxID=3403467 RepID=UPI003EB8A8F6